MKTTKIEWANSSWNPVTGCSKISDGCLNCYAARMANRLYAMGNPRYKNKFKVTLHDDLLNAPYRTKVPTVIFVNSMSDLFHIDVPDEFILKVFETMNNNPQHIFQILTKRSKRLIEMNEVLTWTNNIWMGVTVENEKYLTRVNDLKNTKAHIKFLSCEPLLGSLRKIDLRGIDWIVVGGESGPKARLVEEDWIIELKEMCFNKNVKFFFKQWGGVNKKKNGRLLRGKIYDEMPLAIQ